MKTTTKIAMSMIWLGGKRSGVAILDILRARRVVDRRGRISTRECCKLLRPLTPTNLRYAVARPYCVNTTPSSKSYMFDGKVMQRDLVNDTL
jgi:hypothetical protein